MRRISIGQAILIVVTFAGSIFAAADALTTVPPGVERYARDMDAVLKGSGPISLEPVFEEGFSAAKDLTIVHYSKPIFFSQLERFDEPTYEKVQRMMIGFFVTRAEVELAAPNAGFFLKLAREKGTSVDQAFFEACKKTYPDGFVPAYRQPTTDYGGCTVFDGRTLTEVWGVWSAFQKAYPDRYREATQKELAKVEEELLGNCACGGADGVQKELENFLKAYPSSPMAAKVASHLQAVKNGTSGIRLNCRPS
jgi:hypothetical protein